MNSTGYRSSNPQRIPVYTNVHGTKISGKKAQCATLLQKSYSYDIVRHKTDGVIVPLQSKSGILS